ncbi:hypothetical protein FHS04_002841 [Mesoflavibacter sabulilitoris]|uniref:Uncharacterized protein n=1 Tax=Mesoflavibacter zeaxanthinifaciens subsp. sabulilitoris TaxID=1520893 RepID=A0A2T1NNI2_9FLAO|nr:hypothetical protein [Mesoflavibacter zeaxanthinifaciens]MBB3125297.1 hypothetical protein [Mesoflavibacter zeaxanthinifaciens subsp. sabulilitoris]PSG94459.1 hypothetical protein C7H61_00945 [Mesoflavibacter zeaxanthinifaciens subsp. sabulilitoris]|tara:strand:+ start:106 stop:576 length:471 start_codon:yes stop_codon:yes gene_type:complete
MKKYIIVENNSFKVIESENQPLSFVLVEPNKTYNNNSYVLVNNGVHISWLDEYKWNGKYRCLTVTFKKTKLFELNAIKNIQIVVDVLNEYKNMSDIELNEKYQKALVTEKSELEAEVEQLRIERNNSKKATEKYTELIELMKRIVQNIKELEEDKN